MMYSYTVLLLFLMVTLIMEIGYPICLCDLESCKNDCRVRFGPLGSFPDLNMKEICIKNCKRKYNPRTMYCYY